MIKNKMVLMVILALIGHRLSDPYLVWPGKVFYVLAAIYLILQYITSSRDEEKGIE